MKKKILINNLHKIKIIKFPKDKQIKILRKLQENKEEDSEYHKIKFA